MALDKKALTFGSFLIIIGAALLVINFIDLSMDRLWPLFIIAAGLAFVALFISNRKNYGVLMPASILIIYGILFQFCELTYWDYMGELWPTFILAPGVGLLMMYFFGKKETGFLIPASILISIAAIFFVTLGPFHEYARFWPVLLILFGVWMIWGRRSHSSEEPVE